MTQGATILRRAAESFGQRLRRLRTERKFTQIDLADAAHINQGFLSALERDKRAARQGTIRALAVALDVPEAVLIGAGSDHDAPQPLETRELPLFGSIPAGKPATSQEQLEMFPVLRHMWAPDRFCLRLSFDSMEPTLKPDDIVLVHYRPDVDPALVPGKICACLVDNQPTLKRVNVEIQDDKKVIILRGDNPASPPTIVKDDQPFTIQGVVIKLVSRDL